MTVAEDITRELKLADAAVESTFGSDGNRRYALEAGTRICMIPAVRAARIDIAHLTSYIQDVTTRRPDSDYDEIAVLVVDRFNLDEED